jgi:hypothetical protein
MTSDWNAVDIDTLVRWAGLEQTARSFGAEIGDAVKNAARIRGGFLRPLNPAVEPAELLSAAPAAAAAEHSS